MSDELDQFHYHEVMDRAHLIMCMIQEHLVDHPAMEMHPEYKDVLEEAIKIIYGVYQDFGSAESPEE